MSNHRVNVKREKFRTWIVKCDCGWDVTLVGTSRSGAEAESLTHLVDSALSEAESLASKLSTAQVQEKEIQIKVNTWLTSALDNHKRLSEQAISRLSDDENPVGSSEYDSLQRIIGEYTGMKIIARGIRTQFK